MLFAGGGGLGPQMSKFGQVSNDQHQMSLAGGRYQGLISILSVSYPYPPPPWIACESITLPQLRFHVVINVCADDLTAH